MPVPNKEFSMTKTDMGNAVRFEAKGRITTATAQEFDNELERALRNGQINITLNMNNIVLLTSSGIKVMMKVFKQAAAAGGKFRIENPSANVQNVLGLSMLQQMLVN